MNAPIIDMHGIVKRFPIGTGEELEVLHGIDLTVRKGEFVAIVGASGSGKSTLMNIIGALDRPTEGTYVLDGVDVGTLRDKQLSRIRCRKIGFVFQTFNLVPRTSALKNVALPMMYNGVRGTARTQRARALLDMVEMGDRAGHAPSQLSGGQKQRVAIAGVIAMRPDCLVLDEATAMLDPIGREKVMRTVHRLNDDYGITVVQITHYMEEAATADRVVVMSAGRVVMEGTPKEVFRNVEELRALHLDVPQAAELCHALTAAGCPMADDIIDVEECAAALYELLTGKKAPGAAQEKAEEVSACPQS